MIELIAVLRKIRGCESEIPAQLVLEKYVMSLQKDAARYRYLRKRCWEGTGAIFFASVECETGQSVDAAIDKEIENAKARK